MDLPQPQPVSRRNPFGESPTDALAIGHLEKHPAVLAGVSRCQWMVGRRWAREAQNRPFGMGQHWLWQPTVHVVVVPIRAHYHGSVHGLTPSTTPTYKTNIIARRAHVMIVDHTDSIFVRSDVHFPIVGKFIAIEPGLTAQSVGQLLSTLLASTVLGRVCACLLRGSVSHSTLSTLTVHNCTGPQVAPHTQTGKHFFSSTHCVLLDFLCAAAAVVLNCVGVGKLLKALWQRAIWGPTILPSVLLYFSVLLSLRLINPSTPFTGTH